MNDWEPVIALIVGVLVVLLVFAGLVYFFGWIPSEFNAKLINQKLGTHYTASDFFFSGDTIRLLEEQNIANRPSTYNVTLKDKNHDSE